MDNSRFCDSEALGWIPSKASRDYDYLYLNRYNFEASLVTSTHRRSSHDHYLDVKLISDTSVTELSVYPHDEAIGKCIDPRDNPSSREKKERPDSGDVQSPFAAGRVIDKIPGRSIYLYPQSNQMNNGRIW